MIRSRESGQGGVGSHPGPSGVDYRVWAPGLARVEVEVEAGPGHRRFALDRDGDGYWSGCDEAGRAGDLYLFRLPDGSLLPDVGSRFQPRGIHGASECIDPGSYAWRCASWVRPGWTGQTVYELHVGAFTGEGTFRGALERLEAVADLGVEAIELMPVAEFAGRWNWGYDGVFLFAPARCYGRPDDLRALVDAAHGVGLAVILDVVYNHLGPQGNHLARFHPGYFRTDRPTPWGSPFNLDGEDGGPVRAFLVANASYWLDEYRFDGLRLDATHAIPDASSRHILGEIADAVHERGGFVIAEDERNRAELLRGGSRGSDGMDAVWADDFHHQVRVALTGTRQSYYAGYRGGAADIADALEHGWTYRGQPYAPWGGRPRGGEGRNQPTRSFVFCLENHDQVGNRARGDRLEHLVSPAAFRAASMLLCLSPYAVLIFMGQEWAASTPFLYFTDHGGDLGQAVSAGRTREFPEHGENGESAAPDPEAASTFEASKLRWEERGDGDHARGLDLYRDCLSERRRLADAGAFDRRRWSVSALGSVVALRYRLPGGERLLLVSLGNAAISAGDLPDELAAPAGTEWALVLASGAPRLGGARARPLGREWEVPGPAALWLVATKTEEPDAAG